MSSPKVRPPLAKIQSTLEHSKAKGAELAKQAATARLEEEEAELAKREQARELMERRKAYGRATKRMGSPSPRRPLAGVQPSGFPSPRGAGSSSGSALSSMRSQLSADETRPASLASSPLPSRRTLAARAASPARAAPGSPARAAPASPSRPAPASPARPVYTSPARPGSASARRAGSPQRAATGEEATGAGRKRNAPTGGTPQKGGPKKRPPPPPPEPAAAAGGGGGWRPPLARAATGGGAGRELGELAAEREGRAARVAAVRRDSGSCEDPNPSPDPNPKP